MWGLCLIYLFFYNSCRMARIMIIAIKLRNGLVRNSRICDSREAGNWSINRYLSDGSNQTHS